MLTFDHRLTGLVNAASLARQLDPRLRAKTERANVTIKPFFAQPQRNLDCAHVAGLLQNLRHRKPGIGL